MWQCDSVVLALWLVHLKKETSFLKNRLVPLLKLTMLHTFGQYVLNLLPGPGTALHNLFLDDLLEMTEVDTNLSFQSELNM